jgi:photosystem II stability/assembly factor-like uncharacterized protein
MRGNHRASWLLNVGLVLVVAVVALAGCGGGLSTTRSSPKQSRSRNPDVTSAVSARHRSRRVEEAELVVGREGWARTGGGLFWTRDGGRAWRPITPPVAEPWRLRGAYFQNPRQGSALAEEGDEGASRPVFFSTQDGGRFWHRAPVQIRELALGAAAVSFAPAGGGSVFALITEVGDTASSQGFLLRSDDRGRTWHELPRPPQAGEISFDSPREGWLAGGYPNPRLWRTSDGGHAWDEVRLRPPPGQEVEHVRYLPPRIGRGGRGLLAGVYAGRNSRKTTATVYATADSGRHWHLADAIHLARSGGWLEASTVLAFRGPHDVLAHRPLATPTTVVGARGALSSFVAKGLSDWSRQTFSGRRYGFALANYGDQPGLSFTADGGRSWASAESPLPPRWPTSLAPAAIAGPMVIRRSPNARGRQRGGGKGAAGVCIAPQGRIVVVYLAGGAPIERCLLVSPRQRLEIVNVTGTEGRPGYPERISLAGFHARIAPRRAVLLDEPIGAYLGRGSHYVGGTTPVEIRLDLRARCEAPKAPPCTS